MRIFLKKKKKERNHFEKGLCEILLGRAENRPIRGQKIGN